MKLRQYLDYHQILSAIIKKYLPQKLFLTNRQVENIRKAFANHLSTDIKSSKTQLYRMIQSGGFFGRLLGPLL